MNHLFKGIATALTTPFLENGIDYEQFGEQIVRQLKAKIDALVILGTTGESPTVSKTERREILHFAKSIVKNKIPIIIGTGSNCTKLACEQTLEAKELGADGALIVTPYYNLCEQDGLKSHYSQISKCKFPFIVYNVPKRTGVNVLPETAKTILSFDFAVGIKEANGDIDHVQTLFEVLQNEYAIYCGNDNLTTTFLERNCTGTISVASNIIPFKFKEFISDFKTNYDRYNRNYTNIYSQIFELLSSKPNPIPVKCLIQILYGEKCIFRLPLTMPDINYFNYLHNKINLLNKREQLC